MINCDTPKLTPLFDNTRKRFAECADKYIKPNYQHFLGIDLKMQGDNLVRWSGFHHDYMGTLEKSGLVQFADKKLLAHGFYQATVIINGIKREGKTFFPQQWSREKVVSTIFEAYDNFIQNGLKDVIVTRYGDYQIKGLTLDNMTVEMIITPTGDMPTAYPRFN